MKGHKLRRRMIEKALEAVDEASAEVDTGPSDLEQWAAARLWIRTKQPKVVPFRFNRTQKRYLQKKRAAVKAGKKPWFLVLKFRQGGITTLEQGISYREVVTRRNVQVLTLAHRRESTKNIFKIPLLMHERDPNAPGMAGVGNSYNLEFPGLNSTFAVGTAAAAHEGRGETLQRVHGSEVSRWGRGPKKVEHQKELLSGLTEAAENGEIVLETTPRGVEHFHALYREAERGGNSWTPIFLPWFIHEEYRDEIDDERRDEIRDTMKDDERELVKKHGLDLEQIAWRRRKQTDLKTLFPQEYPEDDVTCFLTSGTLYFDWDVIQELTRKLDGVEPETSQIPGGVKEVWERPRSGRRYVIGADTSEGRPGCDPNGAGVIDVKSGEQVAGIHGLFTPSALAGLMKELALEYNGALIGVERNNHGHAVINEFKHLGWKNKQRLFWCSDTKCGWETTSRTRPVLLEDLANAIDGDMVVNDKRMLSEMTTFRLQDSGKWDHDSGCHDDSIFKWGIAWQMRIHRPKSPGIDVF